MEDAGKIAIDSEAVGEERERVSGLTISNIQPSDAGVYVCRAENDAGTTDASATLTVHGRLLLITPYFSLSHTLSLSIFQLFPRLTSQPIITNTTQSSSWRHSLSAMLQEYRLPA